ncbi:hypothetical protein BW731_01355 [Vagococcus martis]|uniref:Uncharacterized protein n=1 Tax=Vagococcus martis TaxID=1768210 RepID=A0A1V4DET4_9ENTE|nr:hypothetical protein [Vagococcus martis]OPF86941.1 hypothetical protein BW731_01355 [Vagococcus martis]
MNNYYNNSLNYLKKNFTIQNFPLDLFPDFHVEHLQNKVINNPLNQIYNLKKEDIQLECFSITNLTTENIYINPKKSNYFELFLNDDAENIILYVILEKTIGCIESNSDRLFCKLLMAMKPNEKDLNNEHVFTMFQNIERTIKDIY